jgi:hypothetical protein
MDFWQKRNREAALLLESRSILGVGFFVDYTNLAHSPVLDWILVP